MHGPGLLYLIRDPWRWVSPRGVALCGLAPRQLFGYGRSDWSSELIHGLGSKAPAGFRSRRGLSHDDSAPVSSHNAPFPSYKAPRVHHAVWRRGGVAARGARAADRADTADHLTPIFFRTGVIKANQAVDTCSGMGRASGVSVCSMTARGWQSGPLRSQSE